MAAAVNPKKTVDFPPTGHRNADPITDEPGSHPIETGVGAAVAGAAAGMALGVAAGPIAAAFGVAIGAVAGGYAGNRVGEMIDPTTEDNWLRDNFKSRPYVEKGDRYEDFHPAFRYGALAESRHGDAGLDLTDENLQREWERIRENEMSWEKAQGAVKDGYDRTVQIRRQRENPALADEIEED
jgi:hypothetical protein